MCYTSTIQYQITQLKLHLASIFISSVFHTCNTSLSYTVQQEINSTEKNILIWFHFAPPSHMVHK